MEGAEILVPKIGCPLILFYVLSSFFQYPAFTDQRLVINDPSSCFLQFSAFTSQASIILNNWIIFQKWIFSEMDFLRNWVFSSQSQPNRCIFDKRPLIYWIGSEQHNQIIQLAIDCEQYQLLDKGEASDRLLNMVLIYFSCN